MYDGWLTQLVVSEMVLAGRRRSWAGHAPCIFTGSRGGGEGERDTNLACSSSPSRLPRLHAARKTAEDPIPHWGGHTVAAIAVPEMVALVVASGTSG